MKNIIKRNKEDINNVIEKYSNTIYKVALSFTKDSEISKDILQDVLIKYSTFPPVTTGTTLDKSSKTISYIGTLKKIAPILWYNKITTTYTKHKERC